MLTLGLHTLAAQNFSIEMRQVKEMLPWHSKTIGLGDVPAATECLQPAGSGLGMY